MSAFRRLRGLPGSGEGASGLRHDPVASRSADMSEPAQLASTNAPVGATGSSPTCSPTRAALAHEQHAAGLGELLASLASSLTRGPEARVDAAAGSAAAIGDQGLKDVPGMASTLAELDRLRSNLARHRLDLDAQATVPCAQCSPPRVPSPPSLLVDEAAVGGPQQQAAQGQAGADIVVRDESMLREEDAGQERGAECFPRHVAELCAADSPALREMGLSRLAARFVARPRQRTARPPHTASAARSPRPTTRRGASVTDVPNAVQTRGGHRIVDGWRGHWARIRGGQRRGTAGAHG